MQVKELALSEGFTRLRARLRWDELLPQRPLSDLTRVNAPLRPEHTSRLLSSKWAETVFLPLEGQPVEEKIVHFFVSPDDEGVTTALMRKTSFPRSGGVDLQFGLDGRCATYHC